MSHLSHLSPGLISAYNSLTDKHLAGYFSNTRIRRHLQRAGLITRSGRIVPDKEYRHKLSQRAHQRHVRECLAQAIFFKVLEMERLHQIEIKRKLEEFASRERVHKIKVERSRRYEDDVIPILSPHPPTGVRGFRKQHSGPEGEHSESSESLGSSRPNTAPGKMQRPVRLKPIHSNGTTASLRRSSPYRLQESSNENDQLFNCTMTKESRRRLTTMETSNDISPYRLPVINNFVVTPVPPATKRKERGLKVTPSGGTLRGRRLRPTTATSGANVTEDPPMLRSSVHHSRVCVNMVYFGKTVHLSHDLTDMRDDVKVFQQHCGGENLSVYKGKLREGESFQFLSKRHRGFPFSLTFFLNGLQVERLSSCCEFRHRKGSRLGGRHGHFGFVSVEGASPCYKCIIAMGLDKKPTPPPKRVKEEGGREESVISPKDAPEMETEMTGEEAASQSDCERGPPQEVECRVKEAHVTVQSRVRDDYEEDFEADDEGPVEEAKEEKSPSPSSDTETQVKEMDASETEDDEKDDDMKSRSGSSCTSSDQEASDDEATQDHREKAEQTSAVDEEETVAPPDEKDEPYPEEGAATQAESGAAKDPDLQHSAENSTEIDISDTSVPLGQEIKPSDDTSGEKEEVKTEDEGKQEEQGPERAKSVQEKLVEAILKESQCSSEPELSDTSTEEEEEEATDKGHGQKSNDVVPEQQPNLAEELKCEESVGEAEVVEDQEETSEPKEQEEDGTEKELHENRDSTKDELDKKLDEDDEKPASEEEEEEKLEDRGAALHAVSEGNMTPENPASEPEEGTEAKCNDSEAAQKDVEGEENTAEAEEADESSVSELDRKTDETAASEDAEEEAMTMSETVEMKVEPSEEREALSCEEAPASDTEERQQGVSTAASQAEVTTEDSSSSLEGSADTTVEKTADISEDSVKDEGSKDEVKKEEAELVSKDGNRQDEGLGGEQREKSVETNDEVEKEKSEEGSKEAEGEHLEEKEENEKDKKEEEGEDDSKKDEIIEDEANVEDTRTDSNPERQTNKEPADEEDEVAHEEKADESEKDEGSESVENKNGEEESEAKEPVIDKTSEGEEVKETKAERDEEKGEEAETEERNEEEQRESEKSKDDNEKAEEGEEKSAISVEPEKNTDEEKTSGKNTAVSEDVNETSDGNRMTEHTVESEDAKKETEGQSSNSERGEIDGENGEISTGGERNSHNDEEMEASKEESNDEKAAERVEDERITEEEPTEGESAEVKEADSGDGAGKHAEEDEGEQNHGTDVSEGEAQERDESDKQEKTAQKDPEQESEETEITEESKQDPIDTDREQMKQDENGNKPEFSENRDSDLIESIDSKTNEDEAQSSAPTDDGLGGTSRKLDESTATSDRTTCSDQLAAVANGENGEDAEEASKASEEGASVLLKPQAQIEEAPNAEESVAVDEDAPEALAAEDSRDLVTNWVNTHQMSKDFETFVEPLEDLREETSHVQVNSKEETISTELLTVETPPEVMKKSENEENEQIHKVESEGKLEAVESETESKPCEDEPQSDVNKDSTEKKEETEVEEFNQMIQTEENDEESSNGQRKRSKESLEEDEDQKGPTQTQSDVLKTEVESMAGTLHSAASLKAESITERQSEEKTSAHDPGKATETEETKYLRSVSKTDERPASPGGAKDAEESSGKTEEQSREVTEITDFTTSKSDDGSQEESQDGGIRPKPSGGSLNGERRDEQLIKDIKRTLSKDRLSSFSMDETLFGSSSNPLLSAARTES